jgi:hypothetical protein
VTLDAVEIVYNQQPYAIPSDLPRPREDALPLASLCVSRSSGEELVSFPSHFLLMASFMLSFGGSGEPAYIS